MSPESVNSERLTGLLKDILIPEVVFAATAFDLCGEATLAKPTEPREGEGEVLTFLRQQLLFVDTSRRKTIIIVMKR